MRGSHEVCAIVTPEENGFPTTADEATESSQKRFCSSRFSSICRKAAAAPMAQAKGSVFPRQNAAYTAKPASKPPTRARLQTLPRSPKQQSRTSAPATASPRQWQCGGKNNPQVSSPQRSLKSPRRRKHHRGRQQQRHYGRQTIVGHAIAGKIN